LDPWTALKLDESYPLRIMHPPATRQQNQRLNVFELDNMFGGQMTAIQFLQV
jgi:hypothetical protein